VRSLLYDECQATKHWRGVLIARTRSRDFFTARTRSFYDWFDIKRVPGQNLQIDKYDSTKQLSTIIGDTMWPSNITMSSVDLLHELDVFTTRVKTKTVPVLGYSTANVIVQHKSLRRKFISCQWLLLIFFFVVPAVKCFTVRTRSKCLCDKSLSVHISGGTELIFWIFVRKKPWCQQFEGIEYRMSLCRVYNVIESITECHCV